MTLEPVDPDVDLHVASVRTELRPSPLPVLGAIAFGGALGALVRYGVAAAWPHPLGTFGWSTFVVNVTGCVLIGVLMVLIAWVWPTRRLVRPFLGVGVLGGFTTFSTYVADIHAAATAGAAGVALAYLAGTLGAALLGVWAGSAAAKAVLGARRAVVRR